jgi:hypothetical protein
MVLGDGTLFACANSLQEEHLYVLLALDAQKSRRWPGQCEQCDMTNLALDNENESRRVSIVANPRSPTSLRDADVLLEMMGRESLDVVARLADLLIDSARDAGAVEIETAAMNVRRVIAEGSPVMLARAIRDLGDAIAHGGLKTAA